MIWMVYKGVIKKMKMVKKDGWLKKNLRKMMKEEI